MMTKQFNKIVINVPPGRKLGIHLIDNHSQHGASVSDVNEDSPLLGTVFPGDIIAGINEVDCSRMNTTSTWRMQIST